jgi:MFS family permease
LTGVYYGSGAVYQFYPGFSARRVHSYTGFYNRGRAWGITSSVAVTSIPLSTLIGGWLADILGVAPLFAGGGVFIIGVAALAWSNRHVRTARV